MKTTPRKTGFIALAVIVAATIYSLQKDDCKDLEYKADLKKIEQILGGSFKQVESMEETHFYYNRGLLSAAPAEAVYNKTEKLITSVKCHGEDSFKILK